MSAIYGILLIAFGVSLLVLATHPFITFPLSLFLLKSLSRRNRALSTAPISRRICSVSIVVCAHNEERCIAHKLQNLKDCISALEGQGYQAEAFIYFDGCVDKSVEIARAYSTQVHLVVGEKRAGKSVGMNTLLEMACGEVIVFTDANVTIQADTLPSAVTALEDRSIGCVCGHLRYSNADESFTAKTGSLYWRLEEWIKQMETALDSTICADGALFAIRRESFHPVPADVIDDFYTSLSVFISGHRVAQSLELIGYERSAVTRDDEVRRKVRIACRAYNCHQLMKSSIARLPFLRRYFYFSHKWLRWHAGGFFILGAFCSTVGVWILNPFVGFVLSTAIIASVMGALLRVPILGSILDLVITLVAPMWGVVESHRGKKYQVWTPPTTTR